MEKFFFLLSSNVRLNVLLKVGCADLENVGFKNDPETLHTVGNDKKELDD